MYSRLAEQDDTLPVHVFGGGEAWLDAEVAALDLQLEDADYKTDYQHEIDIYLALEEMSQDDFEARVVEAEGTTYDEYVAKLSSDPDFRRAMRHVRVLREKYPAELEVTDEEIAARYEAEKEEQWTRPASLRASHILFKVPDAAADPEAFTQVRCYCGCEAMLDHRHLLDCFERPDGGWERHAVGCAVCQLEARDVLAARAAGTPMPEIIAAIDDTYAGITEENG